jgi:hypothetical protein
MDRLPPTTRWTEIEPPEIVRDGDLICTHAEGSVSLEQYHSPPSGVVQS